MPSPNHDARPPGEPVALLVLHYTGMRSVMAALARLTDSRAKVSAHYLVDEGGGITAMVPEERRAWHAGVAGWGGIDDVNARSIGIEIVNPGHEWGYRPFPPAQIAAVMGLAQAICRRHALPPRAVVGHSDVAPARKTDPGELFPWRLLARHGLGLWPEIPAPPVPVDIEAARKGLARIGYRFDLPATGFSAILRAFQRRWRPALIDGVLDAETTALIAAVARLHLDGEASRLPGGGIAPT